MMPASGPARTRLNGAGDESRVLRVRLEIIISIVGVTRHFSNVVSRLQRDVENQSLTNVQKVSQAVKERP